MKSTGFLMVPKTRSTSLCFFLYPCLRAHLWVGHWVTPHNVSLCVDHSRKGLEIPIAQQG